MPCTQLCWSHPRSRLPSGWSARPSLHSWPACSPYWMQPARQERPWCAVLAVLAPQPAVCSLVSTSLFEDLCFSATCYYRLLVGQLWGGAGKTTLVELQRVYMHTLLTISALVCSLKRGALNMSCSLSLQMPGADDPAVGREAQVLNDCTEAFSAVDHFESTHGLVLPNMSAAFIQQRPALISRLLDVSSKLGLRDEVVHDAVLLMDRTASQAKQVRAGEVVHDAVLPMDRKHHMLYTVYIIYLYIP